MHSLTLDVYFCLMKIWIFRYLNSISIVSLFSQQFLVTISSISWFFNYQALHQLKNYLILSENLFSLSSNVSHIHFLNTQSLVLETYIFNIFTSQQQINRKKHELRIEWNGKHTQKQRRSEQKIIIHRMEQCTTNFGLIAYTNELPESKFTYYIYHIHVLWCWIETSKASKIFEGETYEKCK